MIGHLIQRCTYIKVICLVSTYQFSIYTGVDSKVSFSQYNSLDIILPRETCIDKNYNLLGKSAFDIHKDLAKENSMQVRRINTREGPR